MSVDRQQYNDLPKASGASSGCRRRIARSKQRDRQSGPVLSRRALVALAGGGLAHWAACMAAAQANETETSARGERSTHRAPRAKRVIFLFMEGGPSQLDTLEHKPELKRHAGKSVQLAEDVFQFKGQIMPSLWAFRPSPKTGLYFSSLLPGLSGVSEHLCLLHGMHTDSASHPQATIMMHTGSTNLIRPSMGSWVVHGLGAENADLPPFMTINPLEHLGGVQNYSSAFLPAATHGTRIAVEGNLLPNIQNGFVDAGRQRRYVRLLQDANRELLRRSVVAPDVEGTIRAYDTAVRMQDALPDALSLRDESAATKKLYGISDEHPRNFAVQCLLARRLAEAGVRFIQLTLRGWDNHTDLPTALPGVCRSLDQPAAALIADLHQRGMLHDTLVVWGGEFGRSAAEQNGGQGRRHQNRGFSMFLAGGGVRGGAAYGTTDELGMQAVEGGVHVHDLHATILYLLGLDHQRLTYRHAGRDFRLTDVYGRVVEQVIA